MLGTLATGHSVNSGFFKGGLPVVLSKSVGVSLLALSERKLGSY